MRTINAPNSESAAIWSDCNAREWSTGLDLASYPIRDKHKASEGREWVYVHVCICCLPAKCQMACEPTRK